MAASRQTLDYLLEQLAGAGDVSVRAMFGGHALYCGARIVALIGEDALFVKPTPAGHALISAHLGAVAEAPAYEGAKPSLVVPADQWDDADWLSQLIAASAAQLPAPAPKKPKKPKPC